MFDIFTIVTENKSICSETAEKQILRGGKENEKTLAYVLSLAVILSNDNDACRYF